jgi:hypothetical protein
MGIDPLGGAKKKRTDHLIEHMGIDPLGGAKKEEGEQKRGRGTSRKSEKNVHIRPLNQKKGTPHLNRPLIHTFPNLPTRKMMIGSESARRASMKMLLKVPPLILMTTMIVHQKSPQLKDNRRVKLVKHENHPHHPTRVPTRSRRRVSGWIPHRRAMTAHPIATLTSEIVKGRNTVEKELPRSPKDTSSHIGLDADARGQAVPCRIGMPQKALTGMKNVITVHAHQ